MPTRNQTNIRRDINKLNELVLKCKGDEIALEAIGDVVAASADKVNNAWQAYRAASVEGGRERDERESAITRLLAWVQRWRPVVLIKIPGAAANIRTLPAGASTPYDVIRVAEDMLNFINNNETARAFRDSMINDLGSRLEEAQKETPEAATALPREAICRDHYREACIEANVVLVEGLEIVRSTFGRTSPEYRQFIARSSAKQNIGKSTKNKKEDKRTADSIGLTG